MNRKSVDITCIVIKKLTHVTIKVRSSSRDKALAVRMGMKRFATGACFTIIFTSTSTSNDYGCDYVYDLILFTGVSRTPFLMSVRTVNPVGVTATIYSTFNDIRPWISHEHTILDFQTNVSVCGNLFHTPHIFDVTPLG